MIYVNINDGTLNQILYASEDDHEVVTRNVATGEKRIVQRDEVVQFVSRDVPPQLQSFRDTYDRDRIEGAVEAEPDIDSGLLLDFISDALDLLDTEE